MIVSFKSRGREKFPCEKARGGAGVRPQVVKETHITTRISSNMIYTSNSDR